MKNRIKAKALNIIIGIIGLIAFDFLILCSCGTSFIAKIIENIL